MFQLFRYFDATDAAAPDAAVESSLRTDKPPLLESPYAHEATSNGVGYSYSLHQGAFSCRYEVRRLRDALESLATLQCRVERRLLDRRSAEFLTEPFELDASKWRLKLVTRPTGELSAYLISDNADPVEAHFSLELINRLDSTANIVAGSSETFQSGEALGFTHFATILRVRNRNAGFLFGGSFGVRLDLRLRVAQNESFDCVGDARSCICTWKLRDVCESRVYALKSTVFAFASSSWYDTVRQVYDTLYDRYLSFLPNGKCGDMGQCGAFCYSMADAPIDAKFRLTVVNHDRRRKDFFKKRLHRFQVGLDSQGWSRFVAKKTLENPKAGFQQDGWLTLRAEISLVAPPALDAANCRPLGSVRQSEAEARQPAAVAGLCWKPRE